MANPPGRRKVSAPISVQTEHRNLVQTRVNDECEKEIKERANAVGLSTASWLRMFLYEHLGVSPKKE